MRKILLFAFFAVFFASCKTIEYRDVYSSVHDTTNIYVDRIVRDTAWEKIIVRETGDTVYRERYIAKYIHDTTHELRVRIDTCYISEEVVNDSGSGKWKWWKVYAYGIFFCFVFGVAMTLYYRFNR